MKTRRLGKDGPEVSAIGLGCMGMSEFYQTRDDTRAARVIDRALELGIDFFDTADMYGSGHNEQLLGRLLGARRKRVVLATKFAVMRGEGGAFLGISGKPEYVAKACDASLKRLGTDVIDLYYQHRVDPETPIEDTVGAMARLVEAGKVRHLGLSEAAPETLRRAAKVHPIAALQTEYSLWTRDPESELLSLCRSLGVAFVAYSPLGRGFLTGAIRSTDQLAAGDFRRNAPRFQPGNIDKNLQLVDKLGEIAARKGCSLAQLAIAWVMRRDEVIPIPGTTKVERLEENAGAAELSLSADELAEIDRVAPAGVTAGTRYDARGMGSVHR